MWRRALAGDLPYTMHVRLAFDGDDLVGGITYERYPRSGCGLVTYLVVAPSARRAGVGKQLLSAALADLYSHETAAVFGEVADAERLARFRRWGARLVDARYVQPALAPGLERDRELQLIAFPDMMPLPPFMAGSIVRTFIRELYAVTEGGSPDPEVSIPDRVALR